MVSGKDKLSYTDRRVKSLQSKSSRQCLQWTFRDQFGKVWDIELSIPWPEGLNVTQTSRFGPQSGNSRAEARISPPFSNICRHFFKNGLTRARIRWGLNKNAPLCPKGWRNGHNAADFSRTLVSF